MLSRLTPSQESRRFYVQLGAFIWLFIGFILANIWAGDVIEVLMAGAAARTEAGEGMGQASIILLHVLAGGYIFLYVATFVYLIFHIFRRHE